jgi:acetylornithine/N-succinyldiaminopimelate aminotransferase
MRKAKKQRKASRQITAASAMRDASRCLIPTYQRPPIVLVRGQGCYVYDHRGRKYLDFLAGIAVNALGHAHPRLLRVIQRESKRAIHMSNLFHNMYQGPLAHRLTEWAGMDRAFFTNSGTEAVDGALKLARLTARKRGATDKTRFLALEHSFHGRTFGALSVTHPLSYREPFEPLVPGVEFVRGNDVSDLEAKFDDSVCGIIVEVLQGEGGIYPLSGPFWTRARELATHYGAALIADEIQSGLGRTGRPFAYQRHIGAPDIAVIAKPIAGGLPLGAILARGDYAEAFAPGLHGTTFGGGPLTCAVGLEFLNVMEDDNLLENIRARGAQLRAGLSRLTAEFDFIREIRGEGLMMGLDLSVDGRIYPKAALKHGLLINCTHMHILRLLPPFIVTERQVDDFLVRFRALLAQTKVPPPYLPEPSEPSASHALAGAR